MAKGGEEAWCGNTDGYASGVHHDNDGDQGKVDIFESPLILPRMADIRRESW